MGKVKNCIMSETGLLSLSNKRYETSSEEAAV